MPAALSYPGVYVEEIPSGVRTITGVATSIAAFVGRTARGPTDRPVVVTSWDDFVRNFGGLDLAYPLGFAVRDFYLNGGVQAVIARTFKPDGAIEKAVLDAKGLALEAASPGEWGNKLRVRVTKAANPDDLKDLATQLSVKKTDFFNLDLHDGAVGVTESFINLTAVPSARNVMGVLQNESTLVRAKGAPTAPTGVHAAIDLTKDTWEDLPANDRSTGVDGPAKAKESIAWATATMVTKPRGPVSFCCHRRTSSTCFAFRQTPSGNRYLWRFWPSQPNSAPHTARSSSSTRRTAGPA